ncbi:glycosyltransferase family 25 protein [Xylariaceae sp. AK1471]|nr:glycosyltransferase family 25 protein [Xylariaceae sp. AK1471]
MAALHQPPKHIILGLVSFLLLAFSFILFTSNIGTVTFVSNTHHRLSANRAERLYGSAYRGHSVPRDINRVTNSTLGFDRVLVISLPERSDRHNALTLASALTGFHVEWIDAVRGDAGKTRAVREKLRNTNVESWNGHMSAIRKIVEEGLGSALIMEDDMDWDVRLKPQLERVAQGARALLSSSSNSSPSTSPYGDEWDLLWLGHCGEVFPETLDENKDRPSDDPGIRYMRRRFVIEDDLTVPPREEMTGLFANNNNNFFKEHTRWVHVSAAPVCSFAYALSQKGARKVLYHLSTEQQQQLTRPFDKVLAGLCRRAVSTWGTEYSSADGGLPGLNAKCVSVNPPLFSPHHRHGSKDGSIHGDGDIQTDESREYGWTENIVWSARGNLGNMMQGATRMESQYA